MTDVFPAEWWKMQALSSMFQRIVLEIYTNDKTPLSINLPDF